jgi:hypothetical protein
MRTGSKPSANKRALVALSLVLASVTGAGSAQAFCRTSVCDNKITGTSCVPAQPGDCGKPIFWPSPCIGFSVQQDASDQMPLEVALEVFRTAFEQWMNADCGGGTTPRIDLIDFGPITCDQHEYNQKGGNANIIIFRDDDWPHEGSINILALTTVTYNRDTAEIYDADMELNSANVELTTGDTNVKFDLRSIAVHEAGHFLGLAHSEEVDATMFTDYSPGTMDLRTLSPDDMEAICAAYPPGAAIPAACDPTPRHGFAAICSPPVQAEESQGCCAVAPGSAGTQAGAGIAFAAAFMTWLGRRRKPSSRGSALTAPGVPRR